MGNLFLWITVHCPGCHQDHLGNSVPKNPPDSEAVGLVGALAWYYLKVPSCFCCAAQVETPLQSPGPAQLELLVPRYQCLKGLHVLICKMGTRHLPHRDVKWENPGRCLGLSRDPIVSAPTPPTPKFLPLCGPSPGLQGSCAVWELELPALSSNPVMLFSSCVTLGKDHRRPQIWRVPKNMKLTPHPRLIQ